MLRKDLEKAHEKISWSRKPRAQGRVGKRAWVWPRLCAEAALASDVAVLL